MRSRLSLFVKQVCASTASRARDVVLTTKLPLRPDEPVGGDSLLTSHFLPHTSYFNLHSSRFTSASQRLSPPPTPAVLFALRRIHSGGSTTGGYMRTKREQRSGRGTDLLSKPTPPRPQRFTLASPGVWRSHPSRMSSRPQVSSLSVGFIPAGARLAATNKPNARREAVERRACLANKLQPRPQRLTSASQHGPYPR